MPISRYTKYLAGVHKLYTTQNNITYMVQTKRLLIIFGLLIFSLPAVVFFPNKGTSDMGVWLEWTAHVNRWGPLNAYSIINTNHDYETSDYRRSAFLIFT